MLELIEPGQMVSIERDVFPRLVERGTLYGVALPGYWLDVGTPESYLQAHRDVLERNVPSDVGDALGRDYTTVDPTAEVSPGARLVPPLFALCSSTHRWHRHTRRWRTSTCFRTGTSPRRKGNCAGPSSSIRITPRRITGTRSIWPPPATSPPHWRRFIARGIAIQHR